MKKILSISLILALFQFPLIGFCGEEIGLEDISRTKLNLHPPVEKDTKSLLISKNGELQEIIDLQRQKDSEDLEYLWNKTIENSNLVKFALQKLAIPPEQRRLHSSVMAKTISAIVSGAAFLPMLTGQNAAVQSASFSAGRIATGLLNKAETPKENPLTDTEMIELAGMIENLQTDLLNTYYNYKSSLIQVKNVRARIILANKNYYEALKTDNNMEILISSSLYDNLLIEEMKIKQKVWCYQLQLQRLAGANAVKNLHLYQYALNNQLIKEGE